MKTKHKQKIGKAVKRAWRRRKSGYKRRESAARYPVLPCGCDPSRSHYLKGKYKGEDHKHIVIMKSGERYCGLHGRIFRLAWAEVVVIVQQPKMSRRNEKR